MINLPNFDVNIFINEVCSFIKETVKKSNSDGVVLGLSGGIDSAVVAYLAVKALGTSNVHGYVLPSKTTSEQDLNDALLVKNNLGIDGQIISIENIHTTFLNLCGEKSLPQNNSLLASSNVKPRLRMSILYYYATIYHCLVIGTGNKTELSVGYFTKYGDGGVDLLPIGDLYKEQVVEVAKVLGVPNSIIEKPPTAGLLPEQTDEEELGMTYPILDRLLYLYLENEYNAEKISNILEIDITEVQRIIDLYNNSEHKRNIAPIFKR